MTDYQIAGYCAIATAVGLGLWGAVEAAVEWIKDAQRMAEFEKDMLKDPKYRMPQYTECLPSKPKLNSGGFTLIEMLCAIACLMLLSGMLFSSFSTMSTTTRRTLHTQDQYQDIRFVIRDITQELHEAIPDTVLGSNDAFIVETDIVPFEMHWVSIHDNNAGCETVEFHYYFDGSNTLYKACIPRGYIGWTNGVTVYYPEPNYNIGENPSEWWETPAIGNASYNPVLENVVGVSIRLFNNSNVEFATSMPFKGHGNMVPRYMEMKIDTVDRDVLKRHHNNAAELIAAGDTNMVRSFVFSSQAKVTGM